MIFVLGKIYCNTCTCNLSLYIRVQGIFRNNFRGARPSKRTCTVKSSAARSTSTCRKYRKNDFPWLQYDSNFQGAFCKVCRKAETRGQSSQEVEVCGS